MTKIKKCLFPVAGFGTRFLPATKSVPKEMLPIVTKPLIQYGVEEAMSAMINDMAFVTGKSKRAIEDHFDINYELENTIAGTEKETLMESTQKIINNCSFVYKRQTEMLGLGHAILISQAMIGSEPFAVILPDDLCFGSDLSVIAQMVRLYEQYSCSIVAIEEVPREETHRYGVIAGEEESAGIFRVSDLVEKPAVDVAPSNLAIIGRYVLTPDIFAILKNTPPGKNNELQITDALRTQAKEGNVIGYRFKGQRFDCGSIEGFIEATNFVYSKIKV
tara:strand:- start:3 stop:830 length:828 start_codon:yes stop_codon:yes gene_type:complete